MQLKPKIKTNGEVCSIPRKDQAIEALLALAWKKGKKESPPWLIKEVQSYC